MSICIIEIRFQRIIDLLALIYEIVNIHCICIDSVIKGSIALYMFVFVLMPCPYDRLICSLAMFICSALYELSFMGEIKIYIYFESDYRQPEV